MEKSVVDICLSMDEISALNDQIAEAAHMLFNSTADSLECYNNL